MAQAFEKPAENEIFKSATQLHKFRIASMHIIQSEYSRINKSTRRNGTGLLRVLEAEEMKQKVTAN
jgi:hypothetical protein